MFPTNLDAALVPPSPNDDRTDPRSSIGGTGYNKRDYIIEFILFAIVSALFFISTTGLSAAKLIWFDEIISFQISKLPKVVDIWTALAKNGPDVTPPLNFLLIRASFLLLGEGPIAARMPSAIGMWVMCVCVFAFMARRYRAEYCWAAVFLLLSCDVIMYSMEARPYGAMLGFIGLALVAWQAVTEGRSPIFLRLILWASMACAISCHYYAILVLIPFGLGEITRMGSRRRVDWGSWAALFGSLTPLGFYLPIIRRSGMGSATWSQGLGGLQWGIGTRYLSILPRQCDYQLRPSPVPGGHRPGPRPGSSTWSSRLAGLVGIHRWVVDHLIAHCRSPLGPDLFWSSRWPLGSSRDRKALRSGDPATFRLTRSSC